MIYCGFKERQKTGLDKCYPYDLLELSFLRGRPDSLNITVSDMTSINRPCCVIPKRECATFNHSTDVIKQKALQFWLLTLQNIDRNSWGKNSSGIDNLTKTGDFIIPPAMIELSEKNRYKIANNYHEDFSDASVHSRDSYESL